MNDCDPCWSNPTIARAQLAESNMMNIRQRTLGFILMGIGFVLMAVGVYEFVQTDMFKSSVRLHEPANINGDNGGLFGDVFETTREVLLSEVILSEVAYRLAIREKWAVKYFNDDKIKAAEAVSLMRDRLKVIRVPNTPLVEIHFESDDANEAALIANTVAEAYQDWRIEKTRRLTQQGIAALRQQIEIEDGKIKAAQDELDRLQRELNIPDTEAESVGVQTNFPTYWKARKNLERLNDLRDMITRKMNIEEVDLRLPYDPQEIVIEHAVPSKTPVRHHRPLGAALTFVGLVLFVSGLASVWKTRPLPRHDSPV